MSIRSLSQPKHPDAIDINTKNFKYALKDLINKNNALNIAFALNMEVILIF